jgi:Zn-dependent protease with chaperone function
VAVHQGSEKALFLLSVVVSVVVYVGATLVLPGLLLWIGAAMLVSVLVQGWTLGHIRANGVRVSERQLPEVHRLAVELAARLELERLPAIYVVQADGMLNAFATRFVRRDFVIISSEVLELLVDDGEAELAFVVAHELAHVKRRHALWSWVLAGSRLVPMLHAAWSRACEYTCDAIAADLCPDGAPGGLLVLAAGKRLYQRVDAPAFADQRHTERGFWIGLTESLSSHPTLPKRVAALGAQTQSAVRQAALAPAA